MNKFWLIFGQVYKKNVKSASFWIMLLFPLIIGVIGLVIGYLASSNDEQANVGLVSNSSAYTQVIQAEKNKDYQIKKYASVDSAKKALKKEKIDGYIELTANQSSDQLKVSYTSRNDSKDFDTSAFAKELTSAKMIETAKNIGLSSQELAQLLAPVKVNKKVVAFEDGKEVSKSNSSKDVLQITAMVLSYALMFFIMMYANIIAQEIASEKGTRIMEIILSSTTATTHFFGKLCAVLAVGLTQIAAYVLMGGVGLWYGQRFEMVQEMTKMVDLPTLLKGILSTGLLFFILGLLIYCVIAALLGSLVSRTEEVGQAVTPITLLTLVGFYGGIIANTNPNQEMIKIGSYIPFFSPMIMPVRYAAGTVGILNVWISLVIMLVMLVVITYFTLMMYRSNVLVYSDEGFWKSLKKSFSILSNQKQKTITK